MSGFDQMMVCAMQRKGHPMTAGEALDEATGLAMSAGWPKRSWAGLSTQKAFQKLKKLQDEGFVERKGTKREDGCDRPLWVPVAAYNVNATLPEWSDEPNTKEPHKLEGRSQAQVFAFINSTEDLLDVFARQRREQEELLARQHDELKKVFSNIKRELALYGFKEGEL